MRGHFFLFAFGVRVAKAVDNERDVSLASNTSIYGSEAQLPFYKDDTSPDHIVFDELKGRYRVSSKAFGPSSDDGCLSGDLEQLLAEDGLPELTMYPAVGRAVAAFSLKIQLICEHEWTYGVGVRHDPVRENWYHGSIFGAALKKKKLKESLRLLAEEMVPIDELEPNRRPHASISWQAGLARATADKPIWAGYLTPVAYAARSLRNTRSAAQPRPAPPIVCCSTAPNGVNHAEALIALDET